MSQLHAVPRTTSSASSSRATPSWPTAAPSGALSSNGSRAVGYFWSAALGRPLVWDRDEETAIRSPYGGPKITWGGPPQRPYRNRAHYDLVLPAGSDRQTEIDRLLSLGATRTGAQPDADGELTLADPDGNVFHLLPSRPGD